MSTGPHALVAFLTARLDEDEARTKWKPGEVYDGDRPPEPSPFLTREREVREVEAKRAFLRSATDDLWGGFGCVASGSESQACNVTQETLRALAAIYSDHPDYQQEWRP